MKEAFKPAVQIILVIAVGVCAVWLTSLFVKKNNTQAVNDIVQQVIVKRPVCPDTSDDYQKLVAAGQVVSLADNLNTFASNGEFQNQKITIVKRTGSGSEIACGYLFATITMGNRPMQEKWENIFIDPASFGGHIIDSNAIVDKSDGNTTTLLFDLGKMTYTEGILSNTPESADWAALLNVSDKVSFQIALNTTDPAAKIITLQLAYRCWSPDTGKETNDCSLQVASQ